MISDADNPIPEVYVLWHPDCAIGASLARYVYAWLRPGSGLGPQVYYRCLPDPDGVPWGLPPPLPGEPRGVAEQPATARPRLANLHVVLLLIDEHMVASPGWRHWVGELTKLASPEAMGGRYRFMPIALDSTAFNSAALREMNFLRPGGLPIPPGADPDQAHGIIARSLCKQLTEAMCPLMLGRRPGVGPAGTTQGPQAAPPVRPGPVVPMTGDDLGTKVTVFLSHAKSDGTSPARRIRDYIYGNTQLAAFYDENDIPFGSGFAKVLGAKVGGAETAAMIAVRSASYAARPWCRWELALFRRPTLEPPAATRPAAAGPVTERWRMNPVLVVDALEPGKTSQGMPEFGNATIVRWADDDALPGQEGQIVTTLLRDVLLAEFHSAVGRALPPAAAADRVVINWLPDPTSLLHIPRVKAGGELQVCYPGRGLSGLELDILAEYFPCVEFRSFEEAMS